ncbi:MAG: PQQ-like beta-propeller repeat protein [Comamonadaceae bacterium]|nr:PQQ-like beta-propeller repeat protein [Comamonadaceae bacterium]
MRATDHRVTAFEADTGKRRWIYQRSRAAADAARRSPRWRSRATTWSWPVSRRPAGRAGAGQRRRALGARWSRADAAPPKSSAWPDVRRPAAGRRGGATLCAAAFQGAWSCVEATNGNAALGARPVGGRRASAVTRQRIYAVDAKSQRSRAFADDAGASVVAATKPLEPRD